jgi:hypothetical protein
MTRKTIALFLFLAAAVCAQTKLTPDSVTKNPPRKLFTVTLPNDRNGLEGQPLIVPSVVVASGETHDLLLSATMGNQVYAHDANTGTPLWMTYLGNPIQGSTKIDGWMINDKWGILSTGQVANGILYVVSWTSPDGTPSSGSYRLHAINLKDGTPAQKPLLLTNPGPIQRKQRASLSLVGTNLYIPWGTIQETSAGAHGFITKIDLTTWKIAKELSLTPKGSGAGIWMAGQGLVSDGTYLYALTGNGDYDPAKGNYGECFVKMDLDLTVIDYWSPFRDKDRGKGGGWQDMDLGSSAPVLLKDLGLIAGGGKDGILFVLKTSDMKAGPVVEPTFLTFNGLGLDATPANIQQLDTLHNGKTYHLHYTPIYWKGMLASWGENSNLRIGTVARTGKWTFIGRSAEIASPYAPASPGGMPGSACVLSANGDTNGIYWCSVPDEDANRKITTGRIFAFDAQKLGGPLPDGDAQIPRLWMSDPHHTFNKFMLPVVSGGKIYMATYAHTIEVWGQ